MVRTDSTLPANASDPGDGEWVSASVGAHGFRTEITARSHTVLADEPVDVGGSDSGPTPYEYLLAALGGCMAITLRMYADRKRWPLEGVQIRLRSARAHETDCEACETEDVGIHRIERSVELHGPLSDEQRKRLLQIADRCPVKQTLGRALRVVGVEQGPVEGETDE